MLACLLLLPAPASASVPYDKFCDQDGKVTNDREVLARQARPGELDAIYEDALRGDVRATRFLRTLEVTFEESARVVAENVSSPECAVAPFLPKCRADWRILEPQRGQGRGAARLLKVTQDAYEQRLRELAPQRRLNEAALTMLMTVGPLRARGPAAKSAGAAEARPTAPAAPAAQGAAGGERAGKSFTRVGKAEVKVENAAANAGQTTCTSCGQPTVPAQQSRSGVTPPRNETHVDHIIPKSKGGDGSPDNGQVLCRGCNLEKGAN